MRILAWPAQSERNSYTGLLYTQLEALGADVTDFSVQCMDKGGYTLSNYDIWHIHWPERHFKTTRNPLTATKVTYEVVRWFQKAKDAGVKLIWTVHNLRPHERYHPYLEPYFYNAFAKRLDGWIALSQAAAEEAEAQWRRLGQVPRFVVPHGHYRDFYPAEVSREAARKALGLAAKSKVVANVGAIRDYKNVPHLIHAFRKLERDDVALLVAGKPENDKLEQEVVRSAGSDSRVRLTLGFVPDDRMQDYFAAADLVALPYKAILNSGSAVLALSFSRPILVPDNRALYWLKETAGDSWVKTYTGELNADNLSNALTWAEDVESETAELKGLGWDDVSKQTWQAFEHVLGKRPRGQPS